MASNQSEALAGHIRGLSQAKAAFQALPQIVRERLLAANETTAREIARGAQARLLASPSVQTRALYNSVAWAVTKTNGRARVGITAGSTTVTRLSDRKRVTTKGIQTSKGGRSFVDTPSTRAHFIEFGTRRAPAEPFMIPAAEAEKNPHLSRYMAAGRQIESDVANIGGRNA